MKTIYDVAGIDPGIVHTGAVMLRFNTKRRSIRIATSVIKGLDVDAIVEWCTEPQPDHTFIEGYRPRSHYDTDTEMVDAVAKIKQRTRGQVLDNTGVKKVIRRPLMELVKCWDFDTKTHHQDLRSAARILLYGMVKSSDYNPVLTSVVMDHLAGRTWDVYL